MKFEKQKNRANKTELCLKCSNKKNANTNVELRAEKLKKWFQENEHPSKGIPRTDEVKEALRIARTGVIVSEETKLIMRIKNLGEKNPFFGKKHTKESLEKMSVAGSKNAKRGKDSNFYGKQYHSKGDWYICNDGSKVWMRSSWEIKLAKYLDDKKTEWLYEPKVFPIEYVYNEEKKEGTYKPDFFLIKENKYIEVKGWWRDDALDKYTAFLEQYPKIKIELYNREKFKELSIYVK